MARTTEFPLLNKDDFEYIGERTMYAKDYVRKVVRGYVHATERNQVILDLAKEIHDEKLKPLK